MPLTRAALGAGAFMPICSVKETGAGSHEVLAKVMFTWWPRRGSVPGLPSGYEGRVHTFLVGVRGQGGPAWGRAGEVFLLWEPWNVGVTHSSPAGRQRTHCLVGGRGCWMAQRIVIPRRDSSGMKWLGFPF